MYDLDRMLDGEYSRQHRWQIAQQQAKRERIARDVESIPAKNQGVLLVRIMLIAVSTLLTTGH